MITEENLRMLVNKPWFRFVEGMKVKNLLVGDVSRFSEGMSLEGLVPCVDDEVTESILAKVFLKMEREATLQLDIYGRWLVEIPRTELYDFRESLGELVVVLLMEY